MFIIGRPTIKVGTTKKSAADHEGRHYKKKSAADHKGRHYNKKWRPTIKVGPTLDTMIKVGTTLP
jgi:hypothetical protein